MKKLVIVSIHFRGKTAFKLAWGTVRNDKTIVSEKAVETLKQELKIKRGYTYNIS